jgi:hypothetical protein
MAETQFNSKIIFSLPRIKPRDQYFQTAALENKGASSVVCYNSYVQPLAELAEKQLFCNAVITDNRASSYSTALF